MQTEQIDVLPIHPTDFPLLASIRRRAFSNSPLNPLLFANVTDEAYEAHSVGQFERWNGARGEVEMRKAVVRGTGEVVGMAVWAVFPARSEGTAEAGGELAGEEDKAEKEEEEKKEKHSWPEGTDVERANEFFSQMETAKVEVPHLGLHLIVVDPSKQRLGAGAVLFEWGSRWADERRLPIYLEATDDGARLYQRFGLSKYRPSFEKDNYVVHYMRRLPHSPCSTATSPKPCPAPLLSSASASSPSTPLRILPISPSDYPRLITIETAAFSPSAINQACFSSVTPAAALAHAIEKRFPQAMRDPRKRIVKAVREEEIVGWAMWELPAGGGEGEKVELDKEGEGEDVGFPEGTNEEEAKTFFPKLDLGIKEPHYHLAILVVDPAMHRTGAGRALLEWGIEQADKDGKDIYLESSPEARAVYPRFGFSHFGSPIVGGTQNQLVVYPMRRPARRLSPSTLSSSIPLPNSDTSSLAPPSSAPVLKHPIDVLPASPADLDRLATIQTLALAPFPITRLIFGNVSPEAHHVEAVQRLQKALDDPYKAVCKAVLRQTGEVVGVALWNLAEPPASVEEGGKGHKEKKREWPEGTNVELAEEFYERRHRFKPQQPNYHLSILAVDPEKQRCGAGAALLRWGCKKADEESVPINLNATDVGVPLYARFGFKMDRPPVTAGVNDEIILYPMTRPALTLSPLTRSEIPLIPRIYHLSFRPSRVMNYSFPDVTTEAFVPWVSARMEGTIETREKGGKGDTIVAKRGEEVVGFAWYSFYPAEEERQKPPPGEKGEKKKRVLPEGANVERANRVLDLLEAHKATIPEAHYSLDNLCVLPSAQRGGVGKALTLALMEKARQEGVSVTLEAMEGGVPLYTHLGFKPFAEPLRAPDLPGVDLVVPMRWTPAEE